MVITFSKKTLFNFGANGSVNRLVLARRQINLLAERMNEYDLRSSTLSLMSLILWGSGKFFAVFIGGHV